MEGNNRAREHRACIACFVASAGSTTMPGHSSENPLSLHHTMAPGKREFVIDETQQHTTAML